MTETVHKAVWQGEITIGAVKLRCYVLENGQRIIDADSFAEFMQAAVKPTEEEMLELVRFVKGQT